MRNVIAGLAVVVCLLAGSTLAYAQSAQVVGSVKDESGAVIPGATATARNVETGLVRVVVSDAGGVYRLQALPPGTYSVKIELVGFKTVSRERLVLAIDQSTTFDAVLAAASVSEAVTVTADTPLVDTKQSTVATGISNQQIQDLPVASRRWIDLAMLTPGVSQDNIRGAFYRGNINIGAGTREYSNGFVVDGVNNTWAQMGEPRQNFAMDSIREFKVSSATYKSEFGLATGGMVSVVTKSGTNELHGSAFSFFRDKSITAKTFFETARPDFRRFQNGGTFGGPIVQNRTHFFVALERTDENQFFTVNAGGKWPDYEGTYKSQQYRWTYTAKVDHQLSSSQSVFFRASQEVEYRPIISAGGRVHPSNAYDFAVPRSSYVAGHTWVTRSGLINDFRLQYAYAKYEVAPPYSHGSWDSGDFSAGRVDMCTAVFTYPSLSLGGCGNSQMGPESRFQIKNDSSWVFRGHQLKFGLDFNYITFRSDSLGSPLGSWTFPKDVVYNVNDKTTYPTQYSNSLPTFAEIPTKQFATYLQDDWQIGKDLTVNAGLRYDRQFGAFNEDLTGLLARITDKLGPGRGFPLAIPFNSDTSARGDKNNFGPRLGLSWDATHDGRLTVRTGYGLFYENMRTLQNFGELTWPQAQSIIISNPSYPDPLQGKSRAQFMSTAAPNITVMNNDTVSAYAHQFSAGTSKMLGHDFGITADLIFVQRKSDRDTVDLNLPDKVTKVKPYPQFGRVSSWQSTADNQYRALLLKLDKRMSHGYQYLLSYTLSKSEDSSFQNVHADGYGYVQETSPGLADRRHRLVASGIVQLPWDMQASTIVDLRSSLPFNPTTSLDLNGDGYTGDIPAGVTRYSGCRALNLDAINTFRASKSLSAATAPTCATFVNVDLRISKVFLFGRGQRLEFIGQLFNIANRANFGLPANNITATTFGQTLSLLPNINAPSRQAEFAIRYLF